MELQELNKDLPGNENMGGLKSFIYVAKYDDVLTWPTLPTLATATLDNFAEYTGNIVMKTGKQFFKFYVTLDKGSVNSEAQGEVDGKSLKQSLTIVHPGLQSKIRSFFSSSLNENYVFLVPDAGMDSSVIHMLGSEAFPAKLDSGSAGTGEGTAGLKAANMTFFSYSNRVMAYTGSVPLTPAA